MSIPGAGNPLLLGGAAGGYEIERSLRFNSADSAYFSRTPASAGNRKTWTWAGWVKRSAPALSTIFGVDNGSGTSAGLIFSLTTANSEKIEFYQGGTIYRISTQIFRDFSAWYHIVLALDTTAATANNRIKLYVNGSEVTAFDTLNNPTQNADLPFNSTVTHSIGSDHTNAAPRWHFNGYLADIHFIDGLALAPTAFGEFDATTGVWNPIEYTGTYPGNSFHLDFSDNSTAAALGTDTSGNSNTWTVNNISVAAGAGNDSLVDVPTNGTETDTGVGGEVRGNYFTGNPLDNGGLALANGNLDLGTTSSTDLTVRGTIGITSGKWYWEVTATNLVANPFDKVSVVGIATANSVLPSYVGSNATSWGYVNHNGSKVTNGSPSAYGNAWITNDVIGIAFDADNGKLFFAKNNTWQGSGDPAAGTNAAFTGLTSGPYLPAFNLKNSGASITINAGARPFAYTAPSGFKALCTANLDAPLVTKPSEYMDVVTYTGNGGTQTISGLEFSPDLVWVKSRNNAAWWHVLADAVRGGGYYLHSNNTNAEGGGGTSLVTGFTSDGFTLNNSPNGTVNNSGDTYVAWTWDAGTSTVTNTDGSITSQVRANPSAGFSIVTYTGTGVAGTIGHGLNVAPLVVLTKRRDSADSLYYFTTVIDGTYDYLSLNTIVAKVNSVSSVPTSSVINVSISASLNANGGTYVSYCFAPVAGYSAFGSYTGNGSSDGPFVFLGFRPAVVLVKMSSSTGSWTILDDKREGYNVDNDPLFPNLANAEGTTDLIDITSNGFKVRTTDATFNTNTGTYVYAAWASSPFAYARAR